jgi:KaiC/GvpD/RAD55 family RecA-like ATPase
MQKQLQLIPSGISIIDEGWGGLYKGSNYLLIGAHKSGKTHFGLNFLLQGADQKERCLYFTSKPDKELYELANWMNLNLQDYVDNNSITVVKVIPPEKDYHSGNADLELAEYFDDVIAIIDQFFPTRIVFDEITPFIGFKDETLLELILERFHRKMEDQEITGIIVSSEPVTDAMSSQLQDLADLSNGLIYLDKEINDLYGTISLLPYIEHKSGEIKSNYIFDNQRAMQIDLSVLNNSEKRKQISFH